jgi:putative endonuclease
MRIQLYYVYMMTNRHDTVLYIGVTNDLLRRAHEHKTKLTKGFTSKYNCNKLVYYEVFDFVDLAIRREKQMKNLKRAQKIALINRFNPTWTDLANRKSDSSE